MWDDGDADAPTPKEFEEKVVQAHGVIAALERTLRTSRLYAPDHQVRQQADKEVQAKFQGFFDRYAVLRLEISQTELKLKNKVLMKCEPRDPEAPFRLYKDGIREIRFHRGLDPEELGAFLALLRMDRRELAEADQDLVSLLWAKDFKTIDHLAVDEFDVGDDGSAGGSDLSLGQGLRTDLTALLQALTLPSPAVDSASSAEPAPAPAVGGSGSDAPDAAASSGSWGAGLTVASVLGVSPRPAAPSPVSGGSGRGSSGGESFPSRAPSGHFPGGVPEAAPGMDAVEALLKTPVELPLAEGRRAVEEQTLFDAMHRAVALLNSSLGRGGSLSAAELAPLLRGLVDAHARAGDLPKLGRLLNDLKRQGLLERVESGAAVWDGLVERASAPEVRKLLGVALNGPAAEDLEGLQAYLDLVGGALVPEACAAYAKIRGPKARGALREYIKTHGRSASIPFKGLLEVPEDVLVEIFDILRHLKPSSAALELDAVFERLPRALKLEALAVAAALEGLARARVFRRAFQDPDVSIRAQAFRKAGETPSQDLLTLTQEWIARSEFAGAPYEEKLQAYRAYARLAGDGCLPHVKEIASQKPSLFASPRVNETRKAAVVALGALQTTAAKAQLDEWAKSGDRSLKEFAEEALKLKSADTLRRKF